MRKQFVILGTFVLLVVLVGTIQPTKASPSADCSTFGVGSIPALTSLTIGFTCAATNTVYFGACDAGSVPNDDLFNIVYNNIEVSSNGFAGDREIVNIGSAQVNAGTHTAVLNSLNATIYPPATYAYAISANQSEVSNYLNTWCGTDFYQPSGCLQNIPVFTADTAPNNGTMEFRIMLGNENSRETSGLLQTWDITAGEQLNNKMVYGVPTPRWVRVYWQPDNDDTWYMLTSQYWHNDGTKSSEYGVSCQSNVQPSYHTSFASAVPISQVCFDLLNGCK